MLSLGSCLVVGDLRRDGITVASWAMPESELNALKEFLSTCQVWNTHVKPHATQPPRMFKDVYDKGEWPMFCHSMEDIVRAPYLFEYAIYKGLDIAYEYFREPPCLYSMNCFWTQPANSTYADTHSFHRDADDRKQLAMFLYGEDVEFPDHGAHLYQKGTHRLSDGSVDSYFNDGSNPNPAPTINKAHEIMDKHLQWPPGAPPAQFLTSMTGPAGTMFFTDPSGLHMGVRPSKPRMFAWARFGVSPVPASYVWDNMIPVDKAVLGDRYPTNPEVQNAIKLLVA